MRFVVANVPLVGGVSKHLPNSVHLPFHLTMGIFTAKPHQFTTNLLIAIHEQIGKIEASLTDFSPFEGDACIELDRLNEIYQMGIDFKQEWLDFCQCNFVAGGN